MSHRRHKSARALVAHMRGKKARPSAVVDGLRRLARDQKEAAAIEARLRAMASGIWATDRARERRRKARRRRRPDLRSRRAAAWMFEREDAA